MSRTSNGRGAAATAAPDLVIEAAHEYVVHGWKVLPLNGKVPLAGSRGVHSATNDLEQVARWPHHVNIGIACGNGLVALDIDYRHFGEDSIFELESRHGELPLTISSKTGNGGEHLLFFTTVEIGCSVGKLGRGLDVRGAGGYIVAPPSRHPDTGIVYEWIEPPSSRELSRVPDWLVHKLAGNGNGGADTGFWRKLAANGVEEGGRNHATARLAGHLLGRGVDPEVVLVLLLGWNLRSNHPPLGDREVVAVVSSIARRELTKWTR